MSMCVLSCKFQYKTCPAGSGSGTFPVNNGKVHFRPHARRNCAAKAKGQTQLCGRQAPRIQKKEARQRGPASWVDGCRSSRIKSCSRRAFHLCNHVRDVTTQAQEAQRPLAVRLNKILQETVDCGKNFSATEKFFPLVWTLEGRLTMLISSFELTR